MKICQRCFEEYDEEDDIYIDPTEDIEDLLDEVGVDDVNDLCSDCREELGVVQCLRLNDDEGYLTDEDDDENDDDDL